MTMQQQDPQQKPPPSDEALPDPHICGSPPGPSIHDELSNLKDDDTKDHPSVTFAGIYGGLPNLVDVDATQQLQSTIRADLADEWLNLRGNDGMQRGSALVEKWLNSNGDDVTQHLPAFDNEWLNLDYDDVTQQQRAICRDEADQSPLVGDKEPLLSLAREYESGSPILKEKIKMLSEHYAAIRRTKRDGNCFFRSFMFSYLEYILESQDKAEVDRVVACVEQSKKMLQSIGYEEYIYTDFYSLFIKQLECLLQGKETSISPDELLKRSQEASISNYLVLFLRYVASGEIRRRSDFFQSFIVENGTVNKFCSTSVESMGEESDHVQMIALSDALGVPIRVVNLDSSSCKASSVNEANHHDFIPGNGPNPVKPIITLLYRPGHYDILYPKRLTLPSY
ncbi:OVARIAN TUMOR DOMAIN-containing deubiquitinating enzyme 1-like [Magnolia sinica]|uniref:OVARIAN TUMOR DOMAIN-containing deubiquitinating enzyme 1-like n=1 Tax=Magnolia sinica TaxID=86752 RepID=UPI002659096B|nr:OVARIAN TUMOR DOMAIN-containing deubiquitinating enzyme 1-like [Magnolia sinica]